MYSGNRVLFGRGEPSSLRHRCAATTLAVLLLWTSHALALDRMGPATAQLGQGRFGIGLDYATSDTDLRASGHSVYIGGDYGPTPPVISRSDKSHTAVMNRVDMDRLYATIGYGLTDQIDLFFRLGGSRVDWKDDGGTHAAIAGGIHSTFYSADRLKIGGLAQVSWAEAEFDAIPFSNPFNESHVRMRGDLSLYEVQIAMAASYLLADGLSVYGGPFLYFADGDMDLHKDEPWHVWIPEGRALSLDSSYDIDETCRLGGYVGARYEIVENLTWDVEFQYTDDADAVTTGMIWRM
jgi:hypothetical protein